MENHEMGRIQKGKVINYHIEDIIGQTHAAATAAELVIRSVWFKVEPMPDDTYRFTVKPEAKRWLLFYKATNKIC